ncbi:MAG: phytoene desaturase family protein [Melioribacteraceae bacterium]|nr:phytoene desaturase family protein [Melioribacteraceae bacterium]
MSKKKIAIIGSGFGGLSSALYLSKYFKEIHVYEKNNFAGGKANFINENGFRFDKGPSLLTMPFVIEDVFKNVNENFEDYLRIKKLDVYCKYFWRDGVTINAYSDLNKFESELRKISSADSSNVKKFLKYAQTIYDLTAEIFLFKSFSEIKTFLNLKSLKTLFNIWKIDPFRTMHQSISSYFTNKKIIQLFDRYATYNGSNPYKAPATLNIIPHVEYNIGGYIPEKGIYSIVESMFELAKKKNVTFHFNTEVEEILIEKNKIVGIKEKNNPNIINYDIVISNADINYTYQKLIKSKNLKSAEKIKKLEPSSSALVFYWGVKGTYDNLEIHNILFSDNYEKEFQEIFDEKIIPNDPTIYIYISSKYKKDDAPNGFENWFVMINAPNNSNFDFKKEIDRIKHKIISKINEVLKIDLEEKIFFEKILTPEDIEYETSSYLGSLYGISSNNRKAAFLRQQNKSKEVDGLYFCGGSVHPGGGIPLTILSGKITAELIFKYEK